MRIIRKLLLLIIIIAIIYYFLYAPGTPIKNKLQNKENNQDIIKGLKEIKGAEILENNENIIIAYTAPLPDEVYYETIRIGEEASGKTNKNITIIGFLNNTKTPTPLMKMIFKEKKLLTVEDIRPEKTKILTDLWIYDFTPIRINLTNNQAIITTYHSGNYSTFKEDVINAALNIFEDTGIESIRFTLIGETNKTFTITQDDIIGKIPLNENQSNSSNTGKQTKECPENEKEAYKAFVQAYKKVTSAQQTGNDEMIKKAYDEYKKARECYEKFKTNDNNNQEEKDPYAQ